MSAIDDIWTNIKKVIPNVNISSSGLFRKITEVFGTVIDIVRLEMLRSEQTIIQATKIARITTRNYYIEKAYYYQQGDPLVVINKATQELGYANIDPAKNIIKQASIGSTDIGVFYLNVATASSDRNIIPLNQNQLDAFRAYFQNYLAMGAQFSVASKQPAIFQCGELFIRYNQNYNLDDIKAKMTNAFKDIQMTPRSEPVIYINEVESALISIEGIRDAFFDEVQIKDGDTFLTPTEGLVHIDAGYFNFDPKIYDYTSGIVVFQAI